VDLGYLVFDRAFPQSMVDSTAWFCYQPPQFAVQLAAEASQLWLFA